MQRQMFVMFSWLGWREKGVKVSLERGALSSMPCEEGTSICKNLLIEQSTSS